MDSSLEEEIARLSRPPTAEKAEHAATLGSSPPVILHPQNGAAALRKQAENEMPPQPPAPARLRRGSSGSSTGESSQTGSTGRLGATGGGLRSPQRAAAVLAGKTISDLQLPIAPRSATASPQQQQQQQHQRQGGGSGGLAGAIARNGRTGGGGPRLAANGEKVAGPRPAANGEKVAGFASGAKASPMASAATMTGAGGGGALGKGPSKEEEAWKKSEEALKKKEQSVRNALKEKQRTLQQESLLLATVDKELAQLALDHQTEVNDLRKTLEVVDRELAFLDRDAQRKLEAFEKARTLLSGKVAQKQGITSRLTELIMASEKKRDAKLNEIMRKMTADGPAAAAAAVAAASGGRGGGASYPR